MSWALKGLAGPLKNKIFKLKQGLTLGRQGDVVIPDTKSSAIHARITQTPSGQWIVADNSSKNGTRIDGERITSAPLTAGLKFFIGDQGFEAIEIKAKKEQEVLDEVTAPGVDIAPPEPPRAPVPPAPPAARAARPELRKPAEAKRAPEVKRPPEAKRPPETSRPPEDKRPPDIEAVPTEPPLPAPPPEPPPKMRRYWHEILAEFVATNEEKFSERKRPVSALTPAIVLEFVRGLQVSSKWVIGYGPRKVGPSALDLPIWEPGAPAVCFEILPSSDGVVFKTAHPELVTVNGEGVDSHVLRVGDKIRINETIIEVDFKE